MDDAFQIFDTVLAEIDSLTRILKSNDTRLVRSNNERAILKATGLAWFRNHRPPLSKFFKANELADADQLYNRLLASSDKTPTRSRCLEELKALKKLLVALRSSNASNVLMANAPADRSNEPPNFTPLIEDSTMQEILRRRWQEVLTCLAANAPLAATIMMGGLLEALLLARVNHESNKAAIFKATSAPKQKLTGQTLPLKEWTLQNYIDVAHELGWISQSAKDISTVLRDYRNYVHPYKELSNKISLTSNDALILWEISKSILRQIVANA